MLKLLRMFTKSFAVNVRSLYLFFFVTGMIRRQYNVFAEVDLRGNSELLISTSSIDDSKWYIKLKIQIAPFFNYIKNTRSVEVVSAFIAFSLASKRQGLCCVY